MNTRRSQTRWRPARRSFTLSIIFAVNVLSACSDAPSERSDQITTGDADTGAVEERVPMNVPSALGAVVQWGLTKQVEVWRRIDTVTVYQDEILSILGLFVEIDGVQGEVDTVGPLARAPQVLNDSMLVLTRFSVADPPTPEFWYYNRHSREKVRVSAPDDLYPLVLVFFAPTRPLIAYQVLAEGTRSSSQFVVRRWGNWELIGRSRPWGNCIDSPITLEWTSDEQYIKWHPPQCYDGDPDADSLFLPYP